MAATTIATMAMLNAKCINNISSPKSMVIASSSSSSSSSSKTTSAKPSISLLTTSKPPSSATLAAGTAIAGAIFSTLSTCEPAFAVQQIADIAATAAESSDNRGLALLLPIIPAIAWVLFNILQPALNQINKMRSTKGVIVGLGGAGLGASGFMVTPPHASASASASVAADQMAMIAAAAGGGSDNRGQLLLFVVAPAILWVLYNILQPALNQINKMRS